jgi:hypothetical protein
VRRLIDGDGRAFAAADLALRRALRSATAAAAIVLGLAVHRAETSHLDSRLRLRLCSSPHMVRIDSQQAPGAASVSAPGACCVSFEVP